MDVFRICKYTNDKQYFRQLAKLNFALGWMNITNANSDYGFKIPVNISGL